MIETNPKKLNLAALLEEDAAPTNPRICYKPEGGNFALPGDAYGARYGIKRPMTEHGVKDATGGERLIREWRSYFKRADDAMESVERKLFGGI